MWTPLKDSILILGWEEYTVQELSKMLCKTPDEVRRRIKYYKLRNHTQTYPRYCVYKFDNLHFKNVAPKVTADYLGIRIFEVRLARQKAMKNFYDEK